MRRLLTGLLLLVLLPSLAWAQATQQTGTITTNGDCVAVGTLGKPNGVVSITGTWTGTISATANIGTAAFDTLLLTPIAGGAAVTSTTANGRWTFDRAYTSVKLCATATMTGSAVVDILSLSETMPVTVPTVTLGANQSVNVSQINGVTPLMGNGVTGTGSPRVTIASDNTAFSVNAAQSGTWTVQPGNTANTTAWKVDGSAVTQPVSGTFWQATQPVSAASLPLPTGASTEAKQPALGTAGVASTDVLTVQGIASMTAIKTDGSGVTQPVSGTVTANAGTGNFTVTQGTGTNLHAVIDSGSTTAVTQATASNLNAAVVGTGTAGTPAGGVLTIQGVTSMTKLLVTPDSVALPANQSVNVSQINGVTPLMGAGNTGTGSARVTLATDQAAIATWGKGATASAVPSGGNYIAGNGSGNLTGVIVCDNSTAVSMSTATTTQIIPISGTAGRTYICSINLVTAAANNVALVSGSGTNCASNLAGLAGGTTAATGWNFAANGGLTLGGGLGMVFKSTTTNNEICLVTSAATQLSGSISWTQF